MSCPKNQRMITGVQIVDVKSNRQQSSEDCMVTGIEIDIQTYWKCKVCGHKQKTQEHEEWPSCCDKLMDIRSSYQLNPVEVKS